MLLFILVWIYIFFVSLPIGIAVVSLLTNQKFNANRTIATVFPVDVFVIAGLAAITIFLSYYSLFYKIDLVANCLLIAIAGVLYYLYFNTIKQVILNVKGKPFFYLIFTLVGFSVLLYATQTPSLPDTGLYHAQTIEWIRSFKVIPGLGNLHSRFAFNSHSFLLQALFDVSQLGFKNAHSSALTVFPLNSFLLTLLIVRVLISIRDSTTLQNTIFYFCFFLLITASVFIVPFSNSPVTDTFLFVFSFYIVILFLNYFDFNSPSTAILISFLVVYICTIKTSGLFFILLLPFLFKFKTKNILILFLIAVIVIVPFFIRTYILSGYLIYPFPSINLFNPDWKMPLRLVIEEKKWIESWARIPAMNCDKVLAMSFFQWFPVWWNNLFLLWKVIFVINLLSPIMFVISIVQKKKKYAILYFVLIINVVFWFVAAPFYRFALAALLLNCSLVISEIHQLKLSNIIIFNWNKKLTYILTIVFASRFFYLAKDNLVNRIIFPVSLESTETKVFNEGGFPILVPKEGDKCFDAPLPCTPYPDKNLILRGNSLEEGFKMK